MRVGGVVEAGGPVPALPRVVAAHGQHAIEGVWNIFWWTPDIFSSINKYCPHRCSEWGTPSPLTSAWPFLVTGPGVSRCGASSRCGGRGRTCNEKYLVRSEENYLEDGGAVSSVLIKRLVSNVSVSLESVEVRRQQQCPDKCRILSELLGVGFFNFHQYCACYSTFFLFVIVYTFMWKIHTLRIFCYQPIGDGFVDKHIVEWILFFDVKIEEPFGCRGQSCRKIINVRNWCYQLAATAVTRVHGVTAPAAASNCINKCIWIVFQGSLSCLELQSLTAAVLNS